MRREEREWTYIGWEMEGVLDLPWFRPDGWDHGLCELGTCSYGWVDGS
jgi:hypothetical protein